MEASEILVIFGSALLVFACISRIFFFGRHNITLDIDEYYDSDKNYAAFNFSSFQRALYTMIVSVSTTNFPMALVKGLKERYWLSYFFFVVNTFIMNFILLNLIMAVFFFYYQNYYNKNVSLLLKKGPLFE